MVMVYVKYPLSLRNVEDLLHERGGAALCGGVIAAGLGFPAVALAGAATAAAGLLFVLAAPKRRLAPQHS